VGRCVGQSKAKALLRVRAREFRNGATEPERRLWRILRSSQLNGFKFRRQVAIPPFVVDFLCPAKALIIEVDGWTHEPASDARRDAVLKQRGYTTLRFSNDDVMHNLDAVFGVILEALTILPDRWPHPLAPSPEGEGE
jgi:very-short-patch-repair endonuclease